MATTYRSLAAATLLVAVVITLSFVLPPLIFPSEGEIREDIQCRVEQLVRNEGIRGLAPRLTDEEFAACLARLGE
jgi:hypothetical protein